MRNPWTTWLALFGLFRTTLCAAESDDLSNISNQLKSTNLQQQITAARILGEIGPAAHQSVPSLLELLNADDAGLRYESILALGRINSDAPRVVPMLCDVLPDKQPVLQHVAIEALRKYGPQAKEALPQLKQLLMHESPLIMVSAARAVVEIEHADDPDPSAASVLVIGLQNPRRDVAADAVYGLAFIGAPAVPATQELLKSDDPQTVANACDALAAIGPKGAGGLSRLIDLAKSGQLRVRWHAINALGEIGPDAKSAMPVLIAALKDSDAHINFSAEQSIHKMGIVALPALIECLNDEQSQRSAATIIGAMGSEAKPAVKSLSQLLHAQDPATRREAIFALAALGSDANSEVPELIDALRDQRFSYRGAAAYALGKLRAKSAEVALKASLDERNDPLVRFASACAIIEIDPENKKNVTLALPYLSAALDNERPEIRSEAASAIGRLGPIAKEVVPILQKGLNDQDARVRHASLNALADIGPASQPAVNDIIRTLEQGNSDIRSIACYALGRIGRASKDAILQLRSILQSRDPHERILAAWALSHIAPDEETKKNLLPVLAAALHSDGNPELRMQIAEVIGDIGQDSTLAKEALKAALEDSDESVRKAAEKALNSLR